MRKNLKNKTTKDTLKPFKAPKQLVTYLRLKRVDDLRLHDAYVKTGKSSIGKGDEVVAARKALAYMQDFHPEIDNKYHTDVLSAVGYESNIIADAAKEVKYGQV